MPIGDFICVMVCEDDLGRQEKAGQERQQPNK